MNSLALISAHCMETLPDSITKRRALLAALGEVLLLGSPLKAPIEEMIANLDNQDRTQLQLADMFRNISAPKHITPRSKPK